MTSFMKKWSKTLINKNSSAPHYPTQKENCARVCLGLKYWYIYIYIYFDIEQWKPTLKWFFCFVCTLPNKLAFTSFSPFLNLAQVCILATTKTSHSNPEPQRESQRPAFQVQGHVPAHCQPAMRTSKLILIRIQQCDISTDGYQNNYKPWHFMSQHHK